MSQMHLRKTRKTNKLRDSDSSEHNILNNLKDHVDSGDVLFVVSGEATNNSGAAEALNKRCRSKCPGRRKLNRNLHSKVVEASQFVAVCDDPQYQDRANDEISTKKDISDIMSKKSSVKCIEKPIEPKRKIDISNPSRTKSQGPPAIDKNWKRKIILRQMKNHRISSTLMDNPVTGLRSMQLVRPAEKLRVLQDIFDDFINGHKWESMSLDSGNLTSIMKRIGFSKYGFKTAHKSPYATNEIRKPCRKSRSVIDIVPRHNCIKAEDTRVPSYMGWYWTKSFFKKAKAGYRPGAIPKNIRDIMAYFNGPCSTCMPSDLKTCLTYSEKYDKAADQTIARKPTLKVVRKDGLYYVSMNPLKPSEELNRNQNPYLEDCPPIKFQIALNRQNSEVNELGLLGYPCSDRPAICDDNKEMQDLLKLLSEECENDSEFYKLAKTLCSKPSDLDIEFIAPGANLRDKSIYKDKVYQETQYDKSDFDDTSGSLLVAALKKTTAA